MRKILLFSFVMLLVGCQDKVLAPTTSETVIDWVDFIKINNEQYVALHTIAIAEEDYVGREVGKVKFKVNGNITDPHYTVKDGDAAFWEKGTSIYEVTDMPDLIAVKAPNEVNGYRLYQAENIENKWTFEHLRQEEVTKIEIQKGYTDPMLIQTMTDKTKIEQFLAVLEKGKERTVYGSTEEDPEMYHLVFYDDQPVASFYPLFQARDVWYWHPWEEEILPDEIGDMIKENDVSQ